MSITLTDNDADVSHCLLSFQAILDRLNAHKRDLEALNKAAQDMMEFDEDGCAMKEIQELIERFEALQKNITERREFFQRVTGKWHKFAEQKHKMNAFFKNTQGIVTKRQVKNADDCKKQIEECKVRLSSFCLHCQAHFNYKEFFCCIFFKELLLKPTCSFRNFI